MRSPRKWAFKEGERRGVGMGHPDLERSGTSKGGRVEGQLGMKVQGDIKECGQGYRYQAMVCYDQDNRLVETLRCNSQDRKSVV